MQRVNRHTGETIDMTRVKVGADGTATETEHKVMGIETRVLVAAGLLGVLTYGMFAYDPVPRKPRPKVGGSSGSWLGDESRDKGFSRRKLEDQIEAEVDAAEAEIDDEFEHTDLEDEDVEGEEEEDE
jgi:hypothetical protein